MGWTEIDTSTLARRDENYTNMYVPIKINTELNFFFYDVVMNMCLAWRDETGLI